MLCFSILIFHFRLFTPTIQQEKCGVGNFVLGQIKNLSYSLWDILENFLGGKFWPKIKTLIYNKMIFLNQHGCDGTIYILWARLSPMRKFCALVGFFQTRWGKWGARGTTQRTAPLTCFLLAPFSSKEVKKHIFGIFPKNTSAIFFGSSKEGWKNMGKAPFFKPYLTFPIYTNPMVNKLTFFSPPKLCFGFLWGILKKLFWIFLLSGKQFPLSKISLIISYKSLCFFLLCVRLWQKSAHVGTGIFFYPFFPPFNFFHRQKNYKAKVFSLTFSYGGATRGGPLFFSLRPISKRGLKFSHTKWGGAPGGPHLLKKKYG